MGLTTYAPTTVSLCALVDRLVHAGYPLKRAVNEVASAYGLTPDELYIAIGRRDSNASGRRDASALGRTDSVHGK